MQSLESCFHEAETGKRFWRALMRNPKPSVILCGGQSMKDFQLKAPKTTKKSQKLNKTLKPRVPKCPSPPILHKTHSPPLNSKSHKKAKAQADYGSLLVLSRAALSRTSGPFFRPAIEVWITGTIAPTMIACTSWPVVATTEYHEAAWE